MSNPEVPWEGVANFRDIGGVNTTEGRRVGAGRLFRCGALHLMTETDRATLERCGITTVIDLRSNAERRALPCEWNGVTIVDAPLADDQVVTDILARFEAGTLTSEELEDWWNLTRVFQAPEEQVESVRTVFHTLIEVTRPEAVLIHCRGGKDRTGVIAAFILDALGVTRDDVMADFLRTNDSPRGNTRREATALAKRFRSLSPGALVAIQGVRAEWLEALFARVAQRHGSVSRYLTNFVGIGDAGLEALRANYLGRA